MWCETYAEVILSGCRLWWRHCQGAQLLPGLPCWVPAMPWTRSAMRSRAIPASLRDGG